LGVGIVADVNRLAALRKALLGVLGPGLEKLLPAELRSMMRSFTAGELPQFLIGFCTSRLHCLPASCKSQPAHQSALQYAIHA
jgi:hypothetical protein